MKTWMSALALTVAGAMLATSAFAQGGAAGSAGGSGSGAASGSSSGAGASSGSPSTGSSSSSTDSKGSSPSSSPATGSGTGTGSSSSDMKSDDMKSGSTMKSGRSGRAAGANPETVKAVQQALKDKGHDPGDVDGKMGPKTQAALRDYQQKEGLKATGRLDSETAAKLGVQASMDTSSSPAASPSGSAPSGSSSAPSGSSTSGGASGSTTDGAKTK